MLLLCFNPSDVSLPFSLPSLPWPDNAGHSLTPAHLAAPSPPTLLSGHKSPGTLVIFLNLNYMELFILIAFLLAFMNAVTYAFDGFCLPFIELLLLLIVGPSV